MTEQSAPLADTAPSDAPPPSDTSSANAATQTADTGTPAPTDTPAADTPPAFAIPEAYQKREVDDGKFENAWTDKVNSVDDLWKVASESQKLLGKKHLTPDFATATPNEIEEYYSQTRPASVDEYNFNKSEGEDRTEIENQFANMLYENGVSKHAADNMIAQYQEMESAQQLAMFDPDSFTASMEQLFGNGYEAKATQVRQFLEGNMNDALKTKFQDIPNAYMVTMYEIANNLMQAYGVSEGSPNGGSTNTMSASTAVPNLDDQISAVRNEIGALSTKPHSHEDKKALTDKLADLTRQKHNVKR